MGEKTSSDRVRTIQDLLTAYGDDQARIGGLEARMLAVERYIEEDRAQSKQNAATLSSTQTDIKAVMTTLDGLTDIVSGVVDKQHQAEEEARINALVAERLAAYGVSGEAKRASTPAVPAITPNPMPVVGAGAPPTTGGILAKAAAGETVADAALNAAERGLGLANSMTPQAAYIISGVSIGMMIMMLVAWLWLG